jgi:hypothetical protein
MLAAPPRLVLGPLLGPRGPKDNLSSYKYIKKKLQFQTQLGLTLLMPWDASRVRRAPWTIGILINRKRKSNSSQILSTLPFLWDLLGSKES